MKKSIHKTLVLAGVLPLLLATGASFAVGAGDKLQMDGWTLGEDKTVDVGVIGKLNGRGGPECEECEYWVLDSVGKVARRLKPASGTEK